MSLSIPVEELHQLKNYFEGSLKIINKYISQHDADALVTKVTTKEDPQTTITRTTTRTETSGRKPKVAPIGKCMYCAIRAMKKITTREEFERSEEKCGKNAFHVRDRVLLCDKHKDSNLTKILEVLSGVPPCETDENAILEEIPEPPSKTPEEKDIEELMNDVDQLERLLTDCNPMPCRHEFKDLVLAQYSGTFYAISPVGICYGKVVDDDAISRIESMSKRKEYGDIKGILVELQEKDRKFLQTFGLSYTRSLLS